MGKSPKRKGNKPPQVSEPVRPQGGRQDSVALYRNGQRVEIVESYGQTVLYRYLSSGLSFVCAKEEISMRRY
jgi:hypothetical protein